MSETRRKNNSTRRVLAVTRDAEDARVIKSTLEPEAFEILHANNCDEAYETVKNSDVDLLMIDVTGVKDETETLCSMLHNRTDTASIPIIAITSPEESPQKGRVALEAGADDFLSRPLQPPAILVRARMLLRLKDLHENISKRNTELEVVNQELASRNRELEQSLEMARRLQQTLLPQNYPKVKNVSFYHIYTPADTIGGDIFQIVPLSGNRAAVFLSDISGHGIRAALVMSILKTVFEHVYLEDKNAAQILSDVNSRFQNVMGALSPHIYATAFLMIIDGKNRSMSLASAGHVCPFLVSKRNMSCTEAISIDNVGPALGFFPYHDYKQQENKLERGDIVLGFTDGIFEILNEDSEIYGLERLQNLIERYIHLVPRDLIERILRDTDAFRRNQKRPDDVCMVAAEMH